MSRFIRRGETRIYWLPEGVTEVSLPAIEATITVDTSAFTSALARAGAALTAFDAACSASVTPAFRFAVQVAVEEEARQARLMRAAMLSGDAHAFDLDPDRCWKCDAKPGMDDLDGACWHCWYNLTGESPTPRP